MGRAEGTVSGGATWENISQVVVEDIKTSTRMNGGILCELRWGYLCIEENRRQRCALIKTSSISSILRQARHTRSYIRKHAEAEGHWSEQP